MSLTGERQCKCIEAKLFLKRLCFDKYICQEKCQWKYYSIYKEMNYPKCHSF